MNIVQKLDAKHKKIDLPKISPGMTVRVHQKIKEGDKERIQVFEGMIIAISGKNQLTATMTVRKVASGVGAERIFPIHSPLIVKIESVKQARVRRAKLFYLRDYKKHVKEKKVA